jgi:hypothetical protein
MKKILSILLLLATSAHGASVFDNVTVENTLTMPALSSSTVPYVNSSGVVSSSAVTPTELGALSGVTSSVQTQLNGKEPTITVGSSSQYIRGDKAKVTLDTSVVPENTNLYWTQGRFDSAFGAKTTSVLPEGSNLYWTQGRFDTALSLKSTTNLAEGSNLYWTASRFDTGFAGKTTTNLGEGSNLYYTDARTRSALSATAPLSYNSSTGAFSLIPPDITASQIRFVNKAGNDTTGDGTYLKPFLTVQKANDSITDATNAKRSAIVTAPGFYSETVTLKDNVSIFGYGIDLTQIQAINYTATAGATGRTDLYGISVFGTITTDTTAAASTGVNVNVYASNLGSWVFNGGTTVTNNNILAGGSRANTITNNGGIFLMNGASIFGNLLLAGTGANTYAEIWGGFIQGNVTATGLSQLYIDNTTIYGSGIGVASGANKPTFYYDVGSYPEAGVTPSQWATILPASDSTMLGHTPVVSGNWPTQPKTVSDALEILAARKIPAGKTLYVDGTRTDTYTADGTRQYPFKTIMAAVNQVIANNDSATYNIIVATAAYSESLTFNSLALKRLSLTGTVDQHGNTATITSAGDVVSSTVNNGNLLTLSFHNLSFSGSVNLVGDTNGTLFGSEQISFSHCNLTSLNVTANNLGYFSFYDSTVPLQGGTILFKNVNLGLMSGGDGFTTVGTLSEVTDGAVNKPSAFGNTNLIVERGLITMSTITIGASSYMQTRIGARIGSGAGTLTVNGTLEAYPSFFRSAITVGSGGTFTDHGSTRNNTLTVSGGGTFNPDGKASFATSQLNTGIIAANAKLQVNSYVTTDALAQEMINTGSATNKGVVVQGAASQAANLQEWQKSDGTALAQVASDGSITSGASTSGVQIGTNSSTLAIEQAVGSLTNIPLVISPKGSGSFMTQVPDSTIAAGNARGLYTTDMQHGPRLNASDVASGDYSNIAGGKSNGASGTYSAIGGGYYNHATADRALVFGGDQNTASGVYSVVGGGSVNNASGTYTFVGGGSTNNATGNDSAIVGGVGSTAVGAYSMILGGWSGGTRLFGEVAHANGPFAAQGDAQYSKYLMRNSTTNATPTEVFLETSNSSRLTLPDNFTFAGQLRIVGRQSGGTASAHFVRNVVIKRDTGVASTTLLDSSAVGTDYNPSGWAITISADTTNGSLKIQVTGAAATNIRWVATFDANQVGY